VVSIAQVNEDQELLVITEQGKMLRTPVNQIRTIGRATQGVRLMDLEAPDKVVSIALVAKTEEEVSDDVPVVPEPEEPSGESGPAEPV
jgi:DNA gyrase subunit A